MFLDYILLITPFLFWYFASFVLNNKFFRINKKNYIFFIATIFSGFSIFFTIKKKGYTNIVLLLFTLAIFLECIYSYNITKYPKNERNVEREKCILFILIILILVNIVRIYKQMISGIYRGEICLIIYLLIIIIKYITE